MTPLRRVVAFCDISRVESVSKRNSTTSFTPRSSRWLTTMSAPDCLPMKPVGRPRLHLARLGASKTGCAMFAPARFPPALQVNLGRLSCGNPIDRGSI